MEFIKHVINPKQLVNHQIQSFNDILMNDIPKIIESEPDVVTTQYTVKFSNPSYGKPLDNMTSADAKQQDVTYASSILCNVSLTDSKKLTSNYSKVEICKIPIMKGSMLCIDDSKGICDMDPGGYFVIKGKERVIVPHVRPAYNRIITYKSDDNWLCDFRSVSLTSTGQSVLTQARTDGYSNIEFSLPYIKQFVPAGLAFKALNIDRANIPIVCGLGYYEDDDLVCPTDVHVTFAEILWQQYDSCHEDAKATLVKCIPAQTKCENKTSYVDTILEKEIFNHVPNPSCEKTILHLGRMVERLVNVVSTDEILTDRDDLANKRVDTTGTLVLFLFQGLFKQFIRLLKNSIEAAKNPCPITLIKSINVITVGLNLCFATGNWSVKRTGPPAYMRTGVSQVMCNHNYGSRLSHLRRLTHAVGFKGKNFKIRQLHTSHYGFICPYETPEGERVGVVLNMAMTAGFTRHSSTTDVMESLKECKHIILDDVCVKLPGRVRVLVNGAIVGYTKDLASLRKEILVKLTPNVGSRYFCSELYIWSDEGRFCRPVMVKSKLVEFGKTAQSICSSKDWDKHVELGIVRQVCAVELGEAFIAPTPEAYDTDPFYKSCQFVELAPAAVITDVMAGVIPFYNHTQSPRVAYQSNMGKQAIGIPCFNTKDRWDATLHVLDYPQKAMTASALIEAVGFDVMGHGAVPIVAIATAGGFNQEDSVVLNSSSIERGLFTCVTYRTTADIERRRGQHESEQICIPEPNLRNPNYDYSFLDESGVIDPTKLKALVKRTKTSSGCGSAWLTANIVLIGKVARKMNAGKLLSKDVSQTVKPEEEGYFDRVLDVRGQDGCRIVKVRLRTPRIPEMGDKFASFTAQKGTCGMMLPQWEMPFTKDGIVPDIIINPHAFPSRMTINYLLQMCFDRAAYVTGKKYCATAFSHENVVEEIETAMKDAGLIEGCDEIMYNGTTGKRFKAKIFLGPCPYQRLRHLVSNKIHARMRGPLDVLTHQPVAGRSREGGIKVGEMEQWCKLSHGVSTALKESLFDMSDKYSVPICNKCKRITHNVGYCHHCDSIDVESKDLPYTTKLLFQELAAIGIDIKYD